MSWRPASAATGKPPAQRLGKNREIGPNPELFLRPPEPQPKAGDDFVKDQHDIVLVAESTKPLKIADPRLDHPRVTHHWLGDDRGDVGMIIFEVARHGGFVVPGSS